MSSATGVEVEQAARAYDRAWNAKDLDAIVAEHSEKGTYRLHVGGLPTIRGREALRTAFAASLANWSEVSFQLDRVLCAERFYVWQSTVRGVLARPLDLGSLRVEATGARLKFSGLDVITLDPDGLIETKETYFDLVAPANQAIA